MTKIDINFKNSNENEFLKVFVQFPYFSRASDEIGESALVNWIIDNYKLSYNKKISKEEVLGYLLRMVPQNIIIRKCYGKKVLVLPTRNFFLIKNGKEPINPKQSKNITTEELRKTEEHHDVIIKPINDPSYQSLDITKSYEAFLKHRIASRPEHEKEIIKYFPHLYVLSSKILNDEYTDWHTRMMISSALGYYILEEDIYPDYLENGYVDDLFVLCYVLREIKKHVSINIFTNNWDYEEDVMEIIEKTYENTSKILGNKACDILHLVGLYKFKKLELEEYDGSSNDQIDKLIREKRELLALVAYLVKSIYHTDVSKKNVEYIKQYLKTFSDHDEINRIIKIANQGYELQNYEDRIDSSPQKGLGNELREALLKSLMDDE